jgi:hypothetical protein
MPNTPECIQREGTPLDHCPSAFATAIQAGVCWRVRRYLSYSRLVLWKGRFSSTQTGSPPLSRTRTLTQPSRLSSRDRASVEAN